MRMFEVGKKYNRLTAVVMVERRGNTYYAIYKCDCGKEKKMSVSNVCNGNSTSCGCYAEQMRQQQRLAKIKKIQSSDLPPVKTRACSSCNEKTTNYFKCSGCWNGEVDDELYSLHVGNARNNAGFRY